MTRKVYETFRVLLTERNRCQELNSANNVACPRSSVPDQAEFYTMAGQFTNNKHIQDFRSLPT